jgi:hypothetical protein
MLLYICVIINEYLGGVMFRISKLLVGIAVLAMALNLTVGIEKSHAYQPVDQVNSSYLEGWWRINTHQMMGQTFTPSKNRLDAIGVRASGDGTAGSLTVYLLDLEEIELMTQFNIALATHEKWLYYDFPEDIVINSVGKLHAIYITSNNNDAYWTVSLSDTYPRGNSIIDSKNDTNQDFAFVTYGYDYQAPPAEEGDPIIEEEGGETVEQTGENTSGEAAITPPAAPSQTINSPTLVIAEDVDEDNGEALKISWKASSSSDITGYKVYRSVSSNSGFVAIGTVQKNEQEYTDKTVELGRKYYYYVRSYKDKLESANSNIVQAISVDNMAPQEPKNFYLGDKGTKILNFKWSKNTEEDLAGYVLKVFKKGLDPKTEGVTEIKSFDLAKDRDKYALDFSVDTILSIDTEYDYYLLAKDASGNMSDMVKATDEPIKEDVAEPTEEQSSLFSTQNYIYAGGVLLIVALLCYLIISAVKRKKAKSISPNNTTN